MTLTGERTGQDSAASRHPNRRVRCGVRWPRANTRWGWMLLSPALIVVLGLTLIPIARAIWTSFQQDSPLLPSKFVGWGNYSDVASSNGFVGAWLVTLTFAACTVVLTTTMALGAAALLNSSFPGISVVKPIVMLPWAVPGVIAGVMWRWVFSDSWGALNAALSGAGVIDEYVKWLSTPNLAFMAVVIAQSWSLLPLATIFILVGYQYIPFEQYEAARLDGASFWQTYRFITFPNIRTAVIIVVLYVALMGITAYDIVYSMTSGGPGSATTLASYFTWSISFRELNFGQAAALAVMMAGVSLILVIGLLKALPKDALTDE
ncbi:MAG: Carbohydrate transporter rane protein 1, family [Nocardioides sp.]|nr:Carbohydrate transporter rane protein 1, family [Nocardioides sp.]